jgi:hypothetical protein
MANLIRLKQIEGSEQLQSAISAGEAIGTGSFASAVDVAVSQSLQTSLSASIINIITNNVIPMDKLLSQLGLQNTQPIYTIQFTSSYTKGGKKQIRKTKKMNKSNKSNKSKRIIKKRIKKTRRNLKY